MTHRTSRYRLFHAALALVGSVICGAAVAGPTYTLEQYTGPAITDALKNNRFACLAVGDAISCSAGMMNVLTGRGATNQADASNQSQWGYVVPSPQGDLKDRIVVGTGGNAATPNGDILPSAPGAVEDGFKTNNAGDLFAATGQDLNTAGNLANPDNNSLNPNWDRTGTWDVSIAWLIQALTIDSVRNELMILFDYNQSQNATGSVNYWALISVLDYAGDESTISNQLNFEVKATTQDLSKTVAQQVADFLTTKNALSKPDSTDFGVVFTKTCYLMSGGVVTDAIPTNGACPAGYDYVNNATGDSTTEIIAFLPELNANLEAYLAAGYDTISVRMLFGCFNDADTNPNGSLNTSTGNGYLNSGFTNQCDGGGNVDVYVMANGPGVFVPEPGSLFLTGAALGALGLLRRRRSQL